MPENLRGGFFFDSHCINFLFALGDTQNWWVMCMRTNASLYIIQHRSQNASSHTRCNELLNGKTNEQTNGWMNVRWNAALNTANKHCKCCITRYTEYYIFWEISEHHFHTENSSKIFACRLFQKVIERLIVCKVRKLFSAKTLFWTCSCMQCDRLHLFLLVQLQRDCKKVLLQQFWKSLLLVNQT